jgi:glycosyltransferase involved in cell wall biosynthesis
MKLLILTQKVDKNDAILGFFHRWVEEFSRNCEKVTVICLYKGECDLSENVKVLSLGKEKLQKSSGFFVQILERFKYLRLFYKYIWQERKNYDNVFVHMNQIYVILGGLILRILGKKIGLWYAHGKVSFSLIIATFFANNIFTSTESGFNIKTKKKNIVGQGIDVDLFKPEKIKKDESILSVGRISRVKRIKEMIRWVEQTKFDFVLVGDPVTKDDFEYKMELEKYISERNLQNRIKFIGIRTGRELALEYNKSQIFLNFSQTGSMDKAVMESLSCGIPVVTSNPAFSNNRNVYFLNNINDKKSDIIIQSMNFNPIEIREYVTKKHSVKSLIDKIIIIFRNE